MGADRPKFYANFSLLRRSQTNTKVLSTPLSSDEYRSIVHLVECLEAGGDITASYQELLLQTP
jgi:hypothetical protein